MEVYLEGTFAIIAAVAAAIVGTLLGRSSWLDRSVAKGRMHLSGTRWESKCLPNEKGEIAIEIFEFTKQKKGYVFGTIAVSDRLSMSYNIEGNFNGRFLRLFWDPSNSSENSFFQDYGVYFFELRGDGTFFGYAVGYDAHTSRIEARTDKSLERVAFNCPHIRLR